MHYDLERFVRAQEYSYADALAEITNGCKRTHWMWYIFPQLKALGRSSRAILYGIENLEEARLYLTHPVLGERLKEISRALLALEISDPYRVMGDIDGMKLCSSMTLFAEVEGYDSVFGQVISKFYHGKADEKTIQIVRGESR